MILVHGIHGCEEYRLSVLARILSSRYQSWICDGVLNWLHIQYDKCSRRNCSESTHCPAVKDQWDCVLNHLKELGDKRISCPDGSVQYWNLFLLPQLPAILLYHTSSDQYWEYSNLFRRTSFSLQISIAPSSSRGNSPCRRRVFILFATGCELDRIELFVQYQSILFHEYVQFL